VGVMLYQMLTGRLPFSARDADLMAIAMMHLHNEPPSLRQADPEIAPEIDRIVLSMLRKDPRQRPAIASLAASFARAAGHHDVAEVRARDRPRASDVTLEAGERTTQVDAGTTIIDRAQASSAPTGKRTRRRRRS